ncbi:MAG: polyketide synthase, partial [bacterium]|nr:polyketide synthase [bacterium]
YVPGEDIASVLLKPLSKATEDNDHIYGVIRGSAISHGGYTPSVTAPSVDGEMKVLTDAWKDAGITPDTLSYIEAHGTGTKLGDPVEINALKKAFKSYTVKSRFCAIGSAKAHIGHAEGAAGIVGVIKALLSLQHKTIPAMPKYEKPNPYLQLEDSPFYINTHPEKWEALYDENKEALPLRAGVSSFGFGGAYAHIVVEEYKAGDQEAGIRGAEINLN